MRTDKDGHLKIHYHSDCTFFAGCENMIANFLNSRELEKAFRLTFSYRRSLRYEQGLALRVHTSAKVYGLTFPDPFDIESLFLSSSSRIIRVFGKLVRSVFVPILFLYEMVVLYRLFFSIKPDVLHINNGGYPGALSARAAVVAGRLAGVKFIVMVVNNMAVEYRSISRWLDFPVDIVIAAFVDVFVTGSKAASTRLSKVLRLPARKLAIIHNGIFLRERTETQSQMRERLYLTANSGVVLGVVAQLIPRKGHLILLSALTTLARRDRLPNGRLTLVIEGTGPLFDELNRYVVENKLSDVVRFVGDELNVMNLIGGIDILVFPSISDEDFPNVILEAMGLGKPVIAASLAGTPEQVVDGVTGLLINASDVEGLAMAIDFLCGDFRARDEMGRAAAKRFSAAFTDTIAVEKYSMLYRKNFYPSDE